jgi:hypothetical protein
LSFECTPVIPAKAGIVPPAGKSSLPFRESRVRFARGMSFFGKQDCRAALAMTKSRKINPVLPAPIEPDFVQQCTGISAAFCCWGDFLFTETFCYAKAVPLFSFRFFSKKKGKMAFLKNEKISIARIVCYNYP